MKQASVANGAGMGSGGPANFHNEFGGGEAPVEQPDAGS